jgi:hypothetical protein
MTATLTPSHRLPLRTYGLPRYSKDRYGGRPGTRSRSLS